MNVVEESLFEVQVKECLNEVSQSFIKRVPESVLKQLLSFK